MLMSVEKCCNLYSEEFLVFNFCKNKEDYFVDFTYLP